MSELISQIKDEFIQNADPKTKESAKRFFKEEILVYGLSSKKTNEIAKKFFPKDNSKAEIFELCTILFQSGYIEESFIACNWSYRMQKQFQPEDFIIFENWVKNYISNWATCDTFCNHTIGEFIIKFPEFINELILWTDSENRWVKRAAAVSLIMPARKGLFLEEIFQISNKLLKDQDDMVQKGYGWMLKVASQTHQKEVYDYVLKNKKDMPRTALRYAIEKMPPEMRKKAMTK